MNTARALLSGLVLGVTMMTGSALAREPAPGSDNEKVAPAAAPFQVLVGRWVRPDGGYVITVDSVAADGQLEASYANPNLLPFARAQASREGDAIEVFLKLTAGGYGGSTYTLEYDPEWDTLRGVYYQANARQSYDIYFERSQ